MPLSTIRLLFTEGEIDLNLPNWVIVPQYLTPHFHFFGSIDILGPKIEARLQYLGVA